MRTDLNCDVGESFGAWTMGDDASVIPLVSSVNVACGFHAGDPLTALRTCEIAAAAGVVVGAHVGYRDLVGFGRRALDVEPDELSAEVAYQVGALQAVARLTGTTVRHVKPHGALYTTAAVDPVQAQAVVSAVRGVDPALAVLTLPGSVLAIEAHQAGLRVVTEGFPDRAYAQDGSLVPRGRPGAVLHDPAVVAARAVSLARDGGVETIDGDWLDLPVQTLCLHGDTPGAVGLAAAVREALDAAGVEVASVL